MDDYEKMRKLIKHNKLIAKLIGILWGFANLFLFAHTIKWIYDVNTSAIDRVVFIFLFVGFGSAIISLIESVVMVIPTSLILEKKVKKFVQTHKDVVTYYNSDWNEDSYRSSMVIMLGLVFIIFGHKIFSSIIGTSLIWNILMLFIIGAYLVGIGEGGGGGESNEKRPTSRKVTATTFHYGDHLSSTTYRDDQGNKTTVDHWHF